MRTYPVDSASAAARIVALTMLADGELKQAELDVLERDGGCELLGLAPGQLRDVLHALCEDLLHHGRAADAPLCEVDTHALARLLAEVEDTHLRERVLALCVAVAEADQRVTDGESLVLTQAVDHWGLHARMFARDASVASV